MDSSPLPAVSAPLAAGNAQPVMASRGCWRWDSPTLARVCVRWDWSVRWSSPTARPGACPFGLCPPLSYQIAWGESVFHAGRKNPLDYASCGNPASLPKASALLWPRHSLSGSAHSQAVFTAANGPREIQLSLRHPTDTTALRERRQGALCSQPARVGPERPAPLFCPAHPPGVDGQLRP